jgi:hypothetical protein
MGRFIWELIGGKAVEWVSCLVILPYLYTMVTLKLLKVEGHASNSSKDVSVEEDEVQERLCLDEQGSSGVFVGDHSPAVPTRAGMPTVKSMESLRDISDLSTNMFMSSHAADIQDIQSADRDEEGSASYRYAHRPASSDSTAQSEGYFSKFYLKLAALPFLILFIRFWGSLRIVLQFANPQSSDDLGFLETCRPSSTPHKGSSTPCYSSPHLPQIEKT